MQTRWTKGLDEAGKKELNSQLIASIPVLKRLGQLIEDSIEASTKVQESKETYESPSWAFFQADHVGELRAYRKILRLIDTKEK
jgi:hypothetical protein